ncbi:MAG TPA: cupin domain-containing protein [Solirubrobacter sp.]
MTDPNFLAPEWETPPEMPIKGVRLGAAAGAQELGATLYELPAGTAVSPYHLHYANEELLIVLSGRPLLRTPTGDRRLEPGAVCSFVRGPDGAHGVSNPDDAEEVASVLLVSTMNVPDVAVHLSTGTLLALTEPGGGKVFRAGTDIPVFEALAESLAEDQRGTSTA